MSEILELRLLGRLQLQRGGVPVTEIQARKPLALLSYLAVTARPQPRPHLAGLLWGGLPEARARDNLSKALSALRRVVGDHLTITRQTVALEPDDHFWLDVAAFEVGVTETSIERLQEAIELYEGDLLDGFYVRQAPEYENWVLTQQARLKTFALQALHSLAVHFGKRDNAGRTKAIDYNRRLLQLEPWREEAHRHLMALLAGQGERGAALAQYQTCRDVLAEELGVEPGAETTALYEQIRAGQPSKREETPHHNLSPQPTAFVGRTAELAEICHLITAEPDCRLLTLLGPGGIGKTRLALAVAEAVSDTFAQGVCFVSLAQISSAEYITQTIGKALGIAFTGAVEPKIQLLNYLRAREMLLVIDNCEHVQAGLAILSEMLGTAPKLTLLATSRERLPLQEDWNYDVGGLAYPNNTPSADAEDMASIEAYDAIRLFLQRARQARTQFVLTADDVPALVQLCQAVDGMPLGLELAAPWVRLMDCRTLVEEIKRDPDFLAATQSHFPNRHRSLRVNFNQTWERLSIYEQVILKRLSIFQGGCTYEAAEAVTEANLRQLASLVDKALLRLTSANRYELHEVIRQFALIQLQAASNDETELRQTHCHYFTTFLQEQINDIKAGRQLEAFAAVRADIDNARSAWQWAVDHKDIEALNRSAEMFFLLGEYGGANLEAEMAFHRAVAALIAPADDPAEANLTPQEQNLVGYLLAGEGYMLGRRSRMKEGEGLLEQGLALLDRSSLADPPKLARALNYTCVVKYFRSKLMEAMYLAQAALTLCQQLGEQWLQIVCYNNLGWNALAMEQLDEAKTHFEAGLSLSQKIDDSLDSSYIAAGLAEIAKARGDYRLAEQLLAKYLARKRALGDLLGIAWLTFEFGSLAILQGNYHQAAKLLQEGHGIKTAQLGPDYEYILTPLADVHRLQRNWKIAEDLIGQNVKIAAEQSHWQAQTDIYITFGCLRYDQGQYQQAEQAYRLALDCCDHLNGEVKLASVLRHLGHAIAVSDPSRQAEARQYYTLALRLSLDHLLAPIALDIFVGVSHLLKQRDLFRAVELLALAEYHSASAHETRLKAQEALADVLEQGVANVEGAKAQGQNLDWTEAARWLVDWLAE